MDSEEEEKHSLIQSVHMIDYFTLAHIQCGLAFN